jgi:hypothetical protein
MIAVLRLIATLLVGLPQVLEFLRLVQKRVDEDANERRVKDALNEINRAFEKGDSSALHRVFDPRINPPPGSE